MERCHAGPKWVAVQIHDSWWKTPLFPYSHGYLERISPMLDGAHRVNFRRCTGDAAVAVLMGQVHGRAGQAKGPQLFTDMPTPYSLNRWPRPSETARASSAIM